MSRNSAPSELLYLSPAALAETEGLKRLALCGDAELLAKQLAGDPAFAAGGLCIVLHTEADLDPAIPFPDELYSARFVGSMVEDAIPSTWGELYDKTVLHIVPTSWEVEELDFCFREAVIDAAKRRADERKTLEAQGPNPKAIRYLEAGSLATGSILVGIGFDRPLVGATAGTALAVEIFLHERAMNRLAQSRLKRLDKRLAGRQPGAFIVELKDADQGQ